MAVGIRASGRRILSKEKAKSTFQMEKSMLEPTKIISIVAMEYTPILTETYIKATF